MRGGAAGNDSLGSSFGYVGAGYCCSQSPELIPLTL